MFFFSFMDNHGTQLKAMYELWVSWVYSFGEDDVIHNFMIYSSDEFWAGIFNSLHGFYRVSGSCLRSALELIALGACFQLRLKPKTELEEWKKGKYISFGGVKEKFRQSPYITPLENYLKKRINDSVFDKKGWAKRLYYDRLSALTHSKPEYSSSSWWEGSNGPIYVPESFEKFLVLYFETVSLSYIFVKLARPDLKLPQTIKYIFARNICEEVIGVYPTKVALYSYQFLWKEEFPWWDGKT